MSAVIVYGPMASGKTRNKHALARHFGKSTIVDDYNGRDPLPPSALALTNSDVTGAIHIARALKMAGIAS